VGSVPFPDGFLCLGINASVSLTNPSPLGLVYVARLGSALTMHGGSKRNMVGGLDI